MKLTDFFSKLQLTEKKRVIISPSHKPEKPIKYHLQIHEFKFDQINLSFFKINWINIEGLVFTPKRNSDVLYFIYSFLDDVDTIKKNTILKIKDGRFKTAGYVYREDLNISIQGCTSNRTLLEIFNQIVKNDITALIDFTAENKNFLISHRSI